MDDDESFYTLDIFSLVQQYNMWKEHLPNIKPFYAIKCNDTKIIMEVLLALGTGFDCSNMEELRRAIEVGATPEDIIYANPTKHISHLKYAKDHGISLMTFDSINELEKIQKYYPDARLVLRLRADAKKCVIAFGNKFGCQPEEAVELLNYSKKLGLKVVGLSFHVGTGCQEPGAYSRAIHTATDLIEKAEKMGIKMQYLDIGGGFPGDSDEMFKKITTQINEALEINKNSLKYIQLLAEPGRFLVCRSFTIAANITSIKKNELYINNGIYGSFPCVYLEHTIVCPATLNNEFSKRKRWIIWGQTEELIDKVSDGCWLPERLKIGDWLYFPNMGAYTSVLSVKYHGFAIPEIYPFINNDQW